MEGKFQSAEVWVVVLVAATLLASTGLLGAGVSHAVPRDSYNGSPSGQRGFGTLTAFADARSILSDHPQFPAVARPVYTGELTSPNATGGGYFGFSVAISGTTLVIGAPYENASGKVGAGNAYVFNDTTGQLISTLSTPSPTTYGLFGVSVAISGSTVVVGAPDEKVSGLAEAGHAYLFNAATGALKLKLHTPNAQKGGGFGDSVAITGSTVVVGAPGENASGQYEAGDAYKFNANTGSRISTLVSSDAQTYGGFGSSVAISGSTVVVGAPGEMTDADADAGNAYIFNAKTPGIVSAISSPNPQVVGEFGYSVAIRGAVVYVGAPREGVSGLVDAGHLYTFNATTGSVISTLTSPNAQMEGYFGYSVAITGKSIVVGAPEETVLGDLEAGRAYTFNASGGLVSTLISTNSQAYGLFGLSVAIGGTTIAVGAPLESAYGIGTAGITYLL
jgi:hypothetical protein